MNTFFDSLLKQGTGNAGEKFIEEKIILSNKIGLAIGLGVGVPFTILSLLYFPPLWLLPAGGTSVALSVVWLNRIGLINLSRIVISLLPLMLAASYNAGLTMQGEPPVHGIMMIQLSFSFVPFLVFDLRERGYLMTMVLSVAAVILSFNLYNSLIEIPLDVEVIRTGWLSDLSVFLSIFIGFSNVFILLLQVRDSELKAEQLLGDMMRSNDEIAKSRQETEYNLVKLEEAREKERKRQWISEGLTEVGKLVRKHQDMKEFSDHLISYTVRYLEANQGAFFQLNYRDEQIEMLSAYAYDRKKHVKKTLAFGQDLIGQACLEKDYIYLTQVPKDYIKITSGLGEALPDAIIIMPLKTEDVIEGVIELASFHAFEPYHIEFLEKLGEIVASHLRNIRAGEKMQELLETSQKQTEELRSQEEEMRQNMEELQATQEQMRRIQEEHLKEIERLTLQSAAVNQS